MVARLTTFRSKRRSARKNETELMTEETPKPPQDPAVPAEMGHTGETPQEPRRRPQAEAASRSNGGSGDPFARAELQQISGELSAHFPAHLDRTELVLLEVDPHHLHAYWNIRQADLAKALRELGPGGPQGPMLLRVREIPPDDGEAPGSGEVFDLAVHGLRNRWYVDIRKDGADYETALGMRGANGHVVWLARSNRATVPRAGQSAEYAFPKLTVPTAETGLADLPAGVAFDRPAVDRRFAALYPQPGAATPPPDWPAALAESAAAARAEAEADAGGPVQGEVPADMAHLPPGISPGATEVPPGAEPPLREGELFGSAGAGAAFLGEAPAGAFADFGDGRASHEDRGDGSGGGIAAFGFGSPEAGSPEAGSPEAGAAAFELPETGPAHVADDRIARLARGEPLPPAPEVSAAEPAGEPERVAGLGESLERLAATMRRADESAGFDPDAPSAAPSPGDAGTASEGPGAHGAFAPGRGAVFGADIDALGHGFGPRGEPVQPLPGAEEAGPEDRGPEDRGPEAANGAGPPGAPQGGGEAPLPLESVLSLSSFAFGREDVALEVNAELHIYGRARPGSNLSMFGQHLRLLPDGSFSIRRPLPHGSLVLPILMSQGLGVGEGGGGGD
jgi:hypothetical protein